MTRKSAGARQESDASADGGRPPGTPSNKRNLDERSPSSSPGSQAPRKLDKPSGKQSSPSPNVSLATQHHYDVVGGSPTTNQKRKKAKAGKRSKEAQGQGLQEDQEDSTQDGFVSGSQNNATSDGKAPNFDAIEQQLEQAFEHISQDATYDPVMDVIRHFAEKGYKGKFAEPVSCIKSACKKTLTTISKWTAHVRKDHPSLFKPSLESLLCAGVLKKCKHNCGQEFLNVANHEKKCGSNTATATAQLQAEVNNGSMSSWVSSEGTHWDTITYANARKLIQRGTRLCQELRGKMLGETISLIAGYEKKISLLGHDKVRLMQIIYMPTFLLNMKRGQPLQLSVFKRRLKQFKRGEWEDLLHEAIQNIESNQHDEANQEQFQQLQQTLQSLISNGKAATALKDQNKKSLLSKHELENTFVPSQFPQVDDVDYGEKQEYKEEHHTKITKNTMFDAMRRLQFTPGMTGPTVQFWQQLAKRNTKVILAIVQDVVSNNLPSELVQLLSGTHQTVLSYPDKPGKYRGVGSSDALIKIAAQCLLKAHEKKITTVADQSPDMAVGKPAGMERFIHRIRQKYDFARQEELEDYAFLQIDVKGAFPNTKRIELRKAIEADLPQFLPIFDLIYGSTNLHDAMTSDDGLQTISQADGIIQGNELSTLFFMLYVKRILSTVQADDLLEKLRQYVDDMIIYGKIEEVEPLFRELSAKLEQHNLQLSKNKCKLWMPLADPKESEQAAERLGVERAAAGIRVLGVPVGENNWTQQAFIDEASNFKQMMNRLETQQVSHQHQNKVLQYIPSYFQHFLAATPPTMLMDFAREIDQQADQHFRRMFYAEYSADDFKEKLQDGSDGAPTLGEYLNQRMALPMRLGGMGVLSLQQRCKRAYGISLARFITLDGHASQEQMQQLDQIKTDVGWQQKEVDEISSLKVSRECNDDFNTVIESLMDNSPMAVRQAMFASKAKGTANVIKTQPWVKQTTFNNDEFIFAVRHRIGIGVENLFKIERNADGSLPICRACTDNLPLTMEHAFSCKHIKIKQHNTMVGQVARMLQAAGRNARLEEVNPQDTDNSRPDIVTDCYTAEAGFNQTALDFTSTTAFSPNSPQLPDKPGKAMERSAREKHTKYEEYAAENESKFVPLAMDNHGAIHKEFADFIAETARIAEKRTNYIPKVDLHFPTLWSHIFSSTMMKLYYANVCTLVQKLHR